MKSFTFYTTVAAIVIGTGMVCSSLMVIFVGLIFGPLLLSPLLVTLYLARNLSGTSIQLILLSSTLLYFAYFVYWFYFLHDGAGHLDLPALLYTVPVMGVFWTTAGIIDYLRPRPPEKPAL